MCPWVSVCVFSGLADSHSRGLFAGLSLEGGVIVSRPDVNRKFYGRQVSVRWVCSPRLHGVAHGCLLLAYTGNRARAVKYLRPARLSLALSFYCVSAYFCFNFSAFLAFSPGIVCPLPLP